MLLEILKLLALRLIEIVPATVGVLLAKFLGNLPEYEEFYVDLLLDLYSQWVQVPEFKLRTFDENLQILESGIKVYCVPLFFFPNLKERVIGTTVKIVERKLKWFMVNNVKR